MCCAIRTPFIPTKVPVSSPMRLVDRNIVYSPCVTLRFHCLQPYAPLCVLLYTTPAFPHRVSVSSLLTSLRIPSARFPDLFPHSLHRAFLPAIPRVFPLSSPCVFRAFRHSFPRVLCSCVTHRRRFTVARALCQTKYYFSYKIYLLLFFGLN